MPHITYEGRTLAYTHFGAPHWDEDTPVFVVMSTEYRDTETIGAFYSQFPADVSGIILDNTNMGQSTRLDRALRPEEILAEVRAVCTQLKIARPILVGYCSTAELALWCAQQMPDSAVVLQSPLVRWGGGAFVDFFYSAMKRPIQEADAYTLCVIMNLMDPHVRGFREQRNYFLTDQFALATALQDHKHFWTKTMQNKPVGLFDWDAMPSYDRPVLVVRGAHDPIQPALYLRRQLSGHLHRLVELDNSHRILDDQPERVISEMCSLAAVHRQVSSPAQLVG